MKISFLDKFLLLVLSYMLFVMNLMGAQSSDKVTCSSDRMKLSCFHSLLNYLLINGSRHSEALICYQATAVTVICLA